MARTTSARLAADASDLHGWLRVEWTGSVLEYGDVGTRDRQWLYDLQRRPSAHRAEIAFFERLIDFSASCRTPAARHTLDELVRRHIITVRPDDVRSLLVAAQREDHFVSAANPPQFRLYVEHLSGQVSRDAVDAAAEATTHQEVASRELRDAAYALRPRTLTLVRP